MINIDNRALFIGVNDYRTFDESQHNQPGTSDLHGSRNDAHAFWRVCRELGIPPENLRILTSPALDPEDLGATAAQVGVATEASILEGIEWLGAALGGSGRAPGLLTYSGHGDFVEGEGLVLCPSDVSGGNLEHAIAFRTIEQVLARHHATANLTVVLDCCHSGVAASDPARRVQSLTGRPLPAGLSAQSPLLGDRQILACEPGGTSWQARFSGVFRGALSWAVSAVLEQWKPRVEGTSVELELSYGELLARTRRLLAALSFEQTPLLRGRPGIATTAFFHSGPGAGDDTTTRAPSARRKGGQLDPGVNHTLTTSVAGTPSWQGLVSATSTGSAPTAPLGYTNGTEYWGLDGDFMAAVGHIAESGNGQITFAGSPSTTERPAATGFAMPTDSLWTTLDAMPAGAMFWAAVPAAGAAAGYVTGVVFNLTAPARSGAVWGGTMTWYVGVPSGAAAPEYVIGSATTTLAFGYLPTSYSGYSWSTMTLPPLTWSASSIAVPVATTLPGFSAGDTCTTALAALGSSMYAAVSDNTRMAIQMYGSAGTNEPWVRGNALWEGWSGTALAAVGSTLYLAMQDGAGDICLTSSSTPATGSWSALASTGITLPSGAAGGFALAGSDSQLYLAYLAYSKTVEGNLLNVARWEGGSFSTWSAPSTVAGVAAAGTPALAAFNGTLYLAFTTTETTPNVRLFRHDGTAWVESGNLAPLRDACRGGLRAPALAAYNGRLFLTCLDADSTDVWLCSSADGVTWSGYEDLSGQIPDLLTATNPALGALGSTLFLAWAAVPGSPSPVATRSTLTPS